MAGHTGERRPARRLGKTEGYQVKWLCGGLVQALHGQIQLSHGHQGVGLRVTVFLPAAGLDRA